MPGRSDCFRSNCIPSIQATTRCRLCIFIQCQTAFYPHTGSTTCIKEIGSSENRCFCADCSGGHCSDSLSECLAQQGKSFHLDRPLSHLRAHPNRLAIWIPLDPEYFLQVLEPHTRKHQWENPSLQQAWLNQCESPAYNNSSHQNHCPMDTGEHRHHGRTFPIPTLREAAIFEMIGTETNWHMPKHTLDRSKPPANCSAKPLLGGLRTVHIDRQS